MYRVPTDRDPEPEAEWARDPNLPRRTDRKARAERADRGGPLPQRLRPENVGQGQYRGGISQSPPDQGRSTRP